MFHQLSLVKSNFTPNNTYLAVIIQQGFKQPINTIAWEISNFTFLTLKKSSLRWLKIVSST